MLDYNDYSQLAAQKPVQQNRALLANLESVLSTLFPAGKKRHGKFLIGDVLGSPGDSLEVVLEGDKAGLWTDRENNDGGDIFTLIGGHFCINVQNNFGRVLDESADLVGRSRLKPKPMRKAKSSVALDELGPATAHWNYLDASGNLIAVVYRYDPPGRKKEFRPWDVKKRKVAPPDPRPLYNQPGLVSAQQVVLVEGEKCAQALIDFGVVATTAMHGANAPVDKTDWSPLCGKAVLIWPDRDKAGWEYAMATSQALLNAGASSCDVLLPPDEKPAGWDAADALVDGFDVHGFLLAGQRLPASQVNTTAKAANETNADTQPDIFEDLDWRTEDGLAVAFMQRMSKDWLYCKHWDKWFGWSAGRWNEDRLLGAQYAMRLLARVATKRADSPRLKIRLASANTVSAMQRHIRNDPKHAKLPEEFDADSWLLNTPGGIVDLRTSELQAHRRDAFMTKMTTATPEGRCPQWQTFLSDITAGNMELQSYLQRVAGYCLAGSIQEHALFFLYGTGANGKSVFVNVLSSMLGDYARHAPMEAFMDSGSERHPTELASLRGARMVTATETEQGKRWNESRIKAITGGDPISARFMRQDFFEYLPQFKLVIAGNHKPAIRNVDEALKRRLHMIPFTVRIAEEKRDRWLTEKLLAERSGILAWAVQGCLIWQQNGLQPPSAVQQATSEYFNNEDAIAEFEDEELDRNLQAQVPISEVYARWKGFAERNGYYAGSVRWMSEQLVARGFERSRGTSGIKCLRGLHLKQREESWHKHYDT
jgi:putative DNA primase/helicase